MSNSGAQTVLDRQLYLSQQRVRDDVAARTESYCHFAMSTGKAKQTNSQIQSSAELECTVQYVENSLASGCRQSHVIQKQYSIPPQFIQGNDSQTQPESCDEDNIDQPIPCDYW